MSGPPSSGPPSSGPAPGIYGAPSGPHSPAAPASGGPAAPTSAGLYGTPATSAPPDPSSGPAGYPDFTPPGQFPPPGQFDQQGQFGQPGPDGPPTRRTRSRKGLYIGLAVAGVLILLAAIGIVATTAFNRTTTFDVGSCVKQDGKSAQQVSCDQDGAFTVVSKEDKQENCADKAQPYVVVERSGGNDVLCLRPADQK